MGRNSDADTLMEEALHLPGTGAVPVYIYTMRLMRAGKNDRAITVALFNKQQHPEERFWTFLGLARVYTAAGDKKNAIANWEEVLHNIPTDMVSRRAGFEDALKKLKQST